MFFSSWSLCVECCWVMVWLFHQSAVAEPKHIYKFNAAQFSSRCERTITYDDWQRHIADPVNIYILYIAYCYGWGMFYDVYFGFTKKECWFWFPRSKKAQIWCNIFVWIINFLKFRFLVFLLTIFRILYIHCVFFFCRVEVYPKFAVFPIRSDDNPVEGDGFWTKLGFFVVTRFLRISSFMCKISQYPNDGRMGVKKCVNF